jgi:hypothetical protein
MIRDVLPGSRIRILIFLPHPGSRIQGSKRRWIPDPGSATLSICVLNPYKGHSGFRKSLQPNRQLLKHEVSKFFLVFWGHF